MRNFKKILIMTCVLSLLVVGCVIWALADDAAVEEDTNVGSVAELSELITVAEKAANVNDKYNAVLALREYLDTKVMDTEEEGYKEALLRINAVAVETADIFLDMVPADVEADGVDIDAVGDAFIFADDLLHTFEIPDGTAGFSSVKVKYDEALFKLGAALTKNLDKTIADEETPKTAENKIKLNKASRVIGLCTPYGDGEALNAIMAEFAECVAAHNAAVEKNLAALDRRNDVSNYDLPIYYEENWEKSTVGYGSGALAGWSVTLNGADDNRVGIRQERNGNKYYVMEYREKDTPAGSYIQRGLSSCDASHGLVFEFDIGTFGEIPKQGILIETGSIGSGEFAGKFPNPYFYVNGNGDICSNNKTTVLLKGALTKGGWLHIIIALDPEDFVYNLYVEGQYIGTYDARVEGSTYDHTKVALRLSGGPSTQGEVAYDNFKIYAGDNYRNPDRLVNMTNDERLLYFVDIFTDPTMPVLDRKGAYDRVTDMIRDYCKVDSSTGEYTYADAIADNEELKAAVDTYMTFDIDTLVSDAKIANLKTYISLIDHLREIERSYDTVASRKGALSEITTFINKNFNMMDLSIDLVNANFSSEEDKNVPNGVSDYDEYVIIFNRLSKQTEYDESAKVFVEYMKKFSNATAISATNRYLTSARDLIENDRIDITLITVDTTPFRENFLDLVAAYDVYINADKKVAEVTKTANSKRIVQCMNVINHFRTEEQWEENQDVMLEYINIVKEYILYTDSDGGLLYDVTYSGVDEAVRFFNRAYEYFYNKIQAENIEYITDILNRIAATDDYVEKIGLVSLVDRYVDTNDIDFEDPKIIELLNNLDTCKSELELRGEDYSKYLHQNSVYFINYVEKMRTATTYAEQVEYFEQAALLYFSLDTTVPGTVAAIDTYDEYSVKLGVIEECSVRFLNAVSIYKACQTPDEKYEALVECYYNAQFAELSYEGVSAAMAEYKAAYDAHMSYANAVNADITEIGNAVGSLRTNCGITTIIAIIIKKIFGV